MDDEQLVGLRAKLRSMCRESASGHWFLDSGATFRLPHTGMVVNTRRLIRAVFVGPVPAGSDVVASCGVRQCVAPEHSTTMVKKNSMAKALDLGAVPPPEQAIAAAAGATPNAPVSQRQLPPAVANLSPEKFDQIKSALGSGLSIIQVAKLAGVSPAVVVAANNS